MTNTVRLLALLCVCHIMGMALVAGTSSAADGQTTSQSGAFNVLFIGNSHLFVNDVPARVKRRLQAVKGPTRIQTFARGGAQLSSFTHRADIVSALKSRAWDIVVLQEASATFLSSHGRQRFQQSVDWFMRKIAPKTRVVLYQTWPWRDGSRYFNGQSSNSTEMWNAMRSAYAKVARRPRVIIAPVGTCWVGSPHRAALYSADGNHATVAGSRFAAAIISRTIARGARSGC